MLGQHAMCIFIINNYTAHLGYVLLADSKTGLLITVSWDFTATRLLNLQILREILREIANSPKINPPKLNQKSHCILTRTKNSVHLQCVTERKRERVRFSVQSECITSSPLPSLPLYILTADESGCSRHCIMGLLCRGSVNRSYLICRRMHVHVHTRRLPTK